MGGERGCPSKGRFPPPSDNQGARAFTDKERGQHVERAQFSSVHQGARAFTDKERGQHVERAQFSSVQSLSRVQLFATP